VQANIGYTSFPLKLILLLEASSLMLMLDNKMSIHQKSVAVCVVDMCDRQISNGLSFYFPWPLVER
jgi:hypothetical protein